MKKGIITLVKAKIKGYKDTIKWNNKMIKYAKSWTIDEQDDFYKRKLEEHIKENAELEEKIKHLEEKYLK